MAQMKQWIQTAVRRPGRMTAYCKRKGYAKASYKCLREALKSKDASVRAAARLGLRLKAMHKRGGA